eukprot:801690-Pelagomonas_calceolata.AAC.5
MHQSRLPLKGGLLNLKKWIGTMFGTFSLPLTLLLGIMVLLVAKLSALDLMPSSNLSACSRLTHILADS